MQPIMNRMDASGYMLPNGPMGQPMGMRPQHYGDMFGGMNGPMAPPQGTPQNDPMAVWQGMHHQPQQQPIQYASRAGRMRNAARHQNALSGFGDMAQGFSGGMNALQGFRGGY